MVLWRVAYRGSPSDWSRRGGTLERVSWRGSTGGGPLEVLPSRVSTLGSRIDGFPWRVSTRGAPFSRSPRGDLVETVSMMRSAATGTLKVVQLRGFLEGPIEELPSLFPREGHLDSPLNGFPVGNLLGGGSVQGVPWRISLGGVPWSRTCGGGFLEGFPWRWSLEGVPWKRSVGGDTLEGSDGGVL
jgi:hypothetical protein